DPEGDGHQAGMGGPGGGGGLCLAALEGGEGGAGGGPLEELPARDVVGQGALGFGALGWHGVSLSAGAGEEREANAVRGGGVGAGWLSRASGERGPGLRSANGDEGCCGPNTMPALFSSRDGGYP